MQLKITVAGTGYVGLSNAVLLAQANEVTALDIIQEKVDMINNKQSPIVDAEIETFLVEKELNLTATIDTEAALQDADFVVISTPANYDAETYYFDTRLVETVIPTVLNYIFAAVMIIKSTIPIGYTIELKKKFNTNNIIFSPAFLREGQALYDKLYPSRLVGGEKSERAKQFSQLLADGSLKKDIYILSNASHEVDDSISLSILF